MISAIGLGILTAGHRPGWPVTSQRVAIDHQRDRSCCWPYLGGKVETGVRMDMDSQLPPADVTIFDIAPEAVAGILSDPLPARIARGYRDFHRGPGAFKVDFAVEDGVPWTNTASAPRRHGRLAGTYAELAATERDVHAGRMPERPFVLVGRRYLSRSTALGRQHPPR